MLNDNVGIYAICNLVNGKMYIGQSNNFKRRFSNHRSMLYSGNHFNDHLQNAFNKYGEDNFKIIKLFLCKEDELNNKEIEFIKKYDTLNSKYGYNIKEGGESGKHAEESKKKISASNKGKIRSKKTKEKMAQAKKGEKNPMYEKKGENSPMYGKNHSNEAKEKMSERKSGENHPLSKLKNYEVIEIKRALLDPYEGQTKDLAKFYSSPERIIAVNTINGIKYNKSWTHINILSDKILE